MNVTDLPKHLQLELYIELKILGILLSEESDEFTGDVKDSAEVTDFWPYAEKLGFTYKEYDEIHEARSKVESLKKPNTQTRTWKDALVRGDYLFSQLNLIKKRLIQAKSKLQELEREVERNPSNPLALENLNYLRLSTWYLIRFMRLRTVGQLQDVPPIQDSPDSLTNTQILNNQIEALQKKVLSQRDEIRHIKRQSGRPTRDEMRQIVDENRKKNGIVNYSAVARALGKKSGETAQAWIEELGLKEYAERQT